MCKITPVMRQFLAVACFNLLAFSYGNSTGWGTINFIELQQENTTFPTGSFSLEEATFVATSMSIGGFVGNFAVLPIAKRYGHARALTLMGIPVILSYLLVIFAQNKYWVYISRIMCGFAGGAGVISMPSMVADIAFDSVRGSLNSIYDPCMNTGTTLTFLLGNYFNPVDQAKILIIFPILFVILSAFLPHAPDFWIQKNKKQYAEKSQKFYKGKDAVAHVEALLPAIKGTKEKPIETEFDKITMSDFLTPEAKKAIFIAFTSLTLSFLAGNITTLNFVTAVFVETGSSLSPANSSIVITAIQILANLLVLNVVDRIDRRVLLMTSSIITAATYVIFGFYCMFYSNTPGMEWFPPLCLATITFSGCMGVLPIPFILSVEIFPKKIRSTCLAVVIAMMWVSLFVLGSLFPIIQAQYGLYTCFFIFGGFTTILALYTYFIIPETRGKSSEEIMEILRK